MIRLCAFADEISPDLNQQLDVLHAEHIHWLELRSVWDTNVLDLDDAQVDQIKTVLDERDFGVSGIGSPIGKVPIDQPFGPHLARFRRALTLAQLFDTPYVRMFSFYAPEDFEPAVPPDAYRDEVLERLAEMATLAELAGVTLLLENDKELYGDTVERCIDLLQEVGSPHLQAAFDPANFVQCGEVPFPDAYAALRPWVRHVHVKDIRADGSMVPAGEGLAGWPDLLESLRADHYSGFFSLEPHLTASGKYRGFSGPELFRDASRAFQQLLREIDWQPER